jgi:tRNA/rRNA methyltransferase
MDNCRVVLVRPHYAGNLGATARVMHNFGLSRLVLVDPIADRMEMEARRLSAHGEAILEAAAIVPSLRAAIADCVLVAGTSAKTAGLIRQTVCGAMRELMPRVTEAAAAGPVALVFGPEPSGLTNDEISHCHFLMHIPADESYPALNLAQAVAVSLYELHLCRLDHSQSPTESERVAAHAELERLFEHLRGGLEAVHFLYGPKAAALMHALRHLLGRAKLTATEVGILHGLARQLEWVAARRDEGQPESS